MKVIMATRKETASGLQGPKMLRKESSANFNNGKDLETHCPFVYALSLMGKRWKPAILWKMTEGISRFGSFKKHIPRISEKMLTQHLRELEADGLITRTLFAEVPPRVEYALTDLGASLRPVLQGLNDWGENAKRRRAARG